MTFRWVFILLLGIHSSNFAANSFEVHATVEKLGSKMIFPMFIASSGDQIVSSFTNGCTYIGTLKKQDEKSVQLGATMTCSLDGIESQQHLPLFLLESKGATASYEILEGDTAIWIYTVKIRPIH